MTSPDPNDAQDLANELLAAAIELASTGQAVAMLLAGGPNHPRATGDARLATGIHDLQEAVATLSAARDELIAGANLLVAAPGSVPRSASSDGTRPSRAI